MQRVGHYDAMIKMTGSVWNVDMEKHGACKMDRQNKKCSCIEGWITMELIKKRKINWLGHWLRWNCLLKDALEGMVNGKNVPGRRRYEMINIIMINEICEDTKRKAEKRVEWRSLSLHWKTCSRAEHYDIYISHLTLFSFISSFCSLCKSVYIIFYFSFNIYWGGMWINVFVTA